MLVVSVVVVPTVAVLVAADRIVIWDPYLGERHLTLEELKRLYGPLEQKYLTKQASAPDSVVVDPKAPAA